jgi:hypothetical protein
LIYTAAKNIETTYDNCISGGTCLFLQDGILAPRSRPLLSKHINNYFSESEYKFSEPSEEDFIDIFKAKSLFEILEKFIRPIPYCRYCKTGNRVYAMDLFFISGKKEYLPLLKRPSSPPKPTEIARPDGYFS